MTNQNCPRCNEDGPTLCVCTEPCGYPSCGAGQLLPGQREYEAAAAAWDRAKQRLAGAEDAARAADRERDEAHEDFGRASEELRQHEYLPGIPLYRKLAEAEAAVDRAETTVTTLRELSEEDT